MGEIDIRVNRLETRMDSHEAQCAERYKNITDLLELGRQDRASLRSEVRSYTKYLQLAIILIAFTAVFKETTIASLLQHAITAFVRGGGVTGAGE